MSGKTTRIAMNVKLNLQHYLKGTMIPDDYLVNCSNYEFRHIFGFDHPFVEFSNFKKELKYFKTDLNNWEDLLTNIILFIICDKYIIKMYYIVYVNIWYHAFCTHLYAFLCEDAALIETERVNEEKRQMEKNAIIGIHNENDALRKQVEELRNQSQIQYAEL